MTGIVIGQEAVVPEFGLGRVISFDRGYVEVRPYMLEYPMKFDPINVKLVEIRYQGTRPKEDTY